MGSMIFTSHHMFSLGGVCVNFMPPGIRRGKAVTAQPGPHGGAFDFALALFNDSCAGLDPLDSRKNPTLFSSSRKYRLASVKVSRALPCEYHEAEDTEAEDAEAEDAEAEDAEVEDAEAEDAVPFQKPLFPLSPLPQLHGLQCVYCRARNDP